MESIDGYRRAALSLKELAIDEQEWILRQLDESDRRRVEELLQQMSDSVGVSTIAVSPPGTAEKTDGSHRDVIQEANFEVLAAVIGEQPDWAVALVAAHYPKSGMVQQSVNQLPGNRAERVRSIIKQVRERMKPRVRELVLRSVAEQIRRRSAKEADGTDFESVLTRATMA